jgi:predicted lipoprotein
MHNSGPRCWPSSILYKRILGKDKEPDMFRPKLLFTSLAALALSACAPSDPQAVTSAAIAKQVILPTYSRWVDADRQLAVSALAFCQGKSDLDTARADFLHAQKAWAQLQPLLIGPLAEGNRAWQIQFWPDKKNLVGRQVEQLVSAQPQISSDALAKSSVVVQGLSAYEYILFDAGIDMASVDQKARYCPLLMAIGERQKSLAEDILNSWNSTDGMLAQLSKFPNQRYADSHEAIAELLRVQVTALDSLKKKLGTPLGRQSKGVPQPFQAEAWRSKASLSSLQASLESAETVWSGVDNKGLRGLLPAEQKPLADKIDAAYAQSRKQLAALKPPLVDLLASEQGRQQLNAFYDSLNVVHRLHEGELAKALGIQLGFNANDGD